MGALVSRTRKGAKAYVLRPFKRRGYFLTQEEYRERNPTLFDKIASGKYTEEAVEKMKLKRRDDFLALRKRTLAKVKDPGTRTAIMKKFFTSHKPPKRTPSHHSKKFISIISVTSGIDNKTNRTATIQTTTTTNLSFLSRASSFLTNVHPPTKRFRSPPI